MDLPAQFSQALQIPKGEYYTPKLANVRSDETTLVSMGGTAITNATSEVPIIGTAAFNPCGCVIVYNTKTKTAALSHEAWPDGDEFQRLLNLVRSNNTDNVVTHVIGVSKYGVNEYDNPEDINKMKVEYLTDLLDRISSTPNVMLATFDVYDKPKPHAVAIDTRDGKLIRGSKLFITVGEGDRFSDHFDWPCVSEVGDNFDGTVRELQKQIKR